MSFGTLPFHFFIHGKSCMRKFRKSYDFLYERFYEAGTHNLDPTGLAPEAF